MNLLIIESPGKIKKLSTILGGGWKVAASVGHVRDLPRREMGVEAPAFKPRYELTERGAEVVAKLKNLVNAADAVYLATDPDREGESISWHLQQCLKLKNPFRVTFNEITENAVKTALAKPRTIDVNLVAAQEARRVLDRLVGYMVSPELSRLGGEKLSAGRVQSPAVRLVVDRERAIRAFSVVNHFGVAINFASETGGSWFAEWDTKAPATASFVSENSPYILDRTMAEAVAGVRAVTVTEFQDKETRRAPPPPFTTSTMQQAASVALGLNPKAAMDAAQALYEQGHITYHRTDNPNVSDEALGDIYAVAVGLGLDMASEPRRFKAPEGAQAGHPAITPTHWEAAEAGETPEQRDLYRLIRLRAVACQLADARYAVRTATLGAHLAGYGRAVVFKAQGRTLTHKGWLKLTSEDQTEDPDDKAASELPANPVPGLAPDQAVTAKDGKVMAKATKPPPRFTQASLVKKLEAEGIGRPATYAAIMENIVGRSYVRPDKKFLVPTETGERVVDALAPVFGFMSLSFTRQVEADLDRIAHGQMRYVEVVAHVHTVLEGELGNLSVAEVEAKFPCPECGKGLRRIKGSNGFFWGCSSPREACGYTAPDVKGAPGVRLQVEASAFPCPVCGKPLIHRTKAAVRGKGGFDFWGCSGYRDGCQASYRTKGDAPDYSTGPTGGHAHG